MVNFSCKRPRKKEKAEQTPANADPAPEKEEPASERYANVAGTEERAEHVNENKAEGREEEKQAPVSEQKTAYPPVPFVQRN